MSNEEIPTFEDQVNKFVEGKPVVERTMATCILVNPKTSEVLCLKWNGYDWKTLINGGVEEGEDLLIAAEREIQEETGYQDLKFVGEIGKVKAIFYTAHKDENRISNATGLVFEITSDRQKELVEEEKKKHLPCWIPRDQVKDFVNIDWHLYLINKAEELKLI